MIRPSWDDAPDWARYLARDDDGEWYWYQNKPIPKFSQWEPSGGEYESASSVDINDWRYSCEKRP